MGGKRLPGPLGSQDSGNAANEGARVFGRVSDGTNIRTWSPTPGPVGTRQDDQNAPLAEVPWNGILVAPGIASKIRIPIPGKPGLAIELDTRDPKFRGRTTSTIFFQDITGKRVLRLDYGPNKNMGGAYNYHWNQKSVYTDFGIESHTVVGAGGKIAYRAAKAFRWVGGPLLVIGAAADLYSIVSASRPLRRATEVVTAWTLAWAGARTGGMLGARGGAVAGTFVEPGGGTALGTAIGAFGGAVVGGFLGYWAGEELGGQVYDWGESTVFTSLPEMPVPDLP